MLTLPVGWTEQPEAIASALELIIRTVLHFRRQPSALYVRPQRTMACRGHSVACRSAAMLLMALLLASTFPSAQADSGIASIITATRPHRRLAQGCTTPLTISGAGGSVCNAANGGPATTTVTFTSTTSATSLSNITVTASQGVTCNSGTGTCGCLRLAAAAPACLTQAVLHACCLQSYMLVTWLLTMCVCLWPLLLSAAAAPNQLLQTLTAPLSSATSLSATSRLLVGRLAA